MLRCANWQSTIQGLMNSDKAQGLPSLARADPGDLTSVRHELDLLDPSGALSPIPMESIHIGNGVLKDLGAIIDTLAPGQKILMVSDGVDILCGGEPLKDAIFDILGENHAVKRIVLNEQGGGELHASETHIPPIMESLQGISCVVGVGGGTVADLCKYALHRSGTDLTLVLIQTMLSVNAFSDGVAVILKNGVKRTVQARYPSILLIDMDVVRHAPLERTLSGYGDLMATWTAPADWLLAHELHMSSRYHRAPYEMLRFQCLELLSRSGDLRAKEPESLELLARVLTLSGLSMGIVGESSPASGAEHTISHLLDMCAESRGRPLAFHGAQVGVSSLVMSCAWEAFLNDFDPSRVNMDACFPTAPFMESMVRSAFRGLDAEGALPQECWEDYRKKLYIWHDRKEQLSLLLGGWSSNRERFRSMVLPPELLAECMHQAGAPTRFCRLNPAVDRATALWAIKNCHLYRSRFTLVDLLSFLGMWSDAFIDRIIERLELMDAGF
jgi:glycerol-1-phosphate dehydrogenase [NAD(P)+]